MFLQANTLERHNVVFTQGTIAERVTHLFFSKITYGCLYSIKCTMSDLFEASRINYESFNDVKEQHQHLVHREPTVQEMVNAKALIGKFAEYICSPYGNECLLSQILRYRVGVSDSLMENIYVFINIILKKNIFFTFSPQYGVSLWPHDVGFQKFKGLEKLINEEPHHYFNDFLSETTTFIVFHVDFRYNDVFDKKFREHFFCQSLHTILKFGKKEKRLNLIKSIIKSSLLMHQINEL